MYSSGDIDVQHFYKSTFYCMHWIWWLSLQTNTKIKMKKKKMEPNSHRKYQLWIWNDDSMKSLHLVVCMCAQCLCVYMISVRIWIQNVYMNHRHNCEKERIKHFSVRIYWLLQPKIIISINATVRNLCGALTKEFLHNSKHFIPFHFVKVLIFLPDASILHSSDDNISECFCDMTQFRYIFDEKKKTRRKH